MNNAQEIRNQVDQFLKDKGITVSFGYLGEGVMQHGNFTPKHPKKVGKDEWACDAWTVTLFSERGGALESYYTGLGHRKWDKRMGFRTSTPFLQPEDATDTVPSIRYVGAPNTLYREEKEKQWFRPVRPYAADFFHSIDDSANTQSFENWCSEYGYDPDSRKDFALYETCQRLWDRGVRVVGLDNLRAIRELVQEL